MTNQQHTLQLVQRIVLIVAILICAWTFSGSLVIYNKWLFNVCTSDSPETCKGWGFPFPLLVTFVHMLFIFLVLHIAIYVLRLIEKPQIDPAVYWKRLVPYACLVAGDIALSNVAFLYLQATFVEMCKSSMPAVVMFLSLSMGIETFSAFLVAPMVIICSGLAIASFGEADFSLLGFIMVMLAVVMGSTKLVLAQVLLQPSVAPPVEGANGAGNGHPHGDEDALGEEDGSEETGLIELDAVGSPQRHAVGSPHSPAIQIAQQSAKEVVFGGLSSLQILYLQTPISAALLLIPSVISVLSRAHTVEFPEDVRDYLLRTSGVVLIGGCMALLLDLFNLLLLKYTSALSTTVAGVARTSLIILFSWMFFRNKVTPMNLYGYLLCMVGVVMYNIYKYNKLRREVVTESYQIATTEQDNMSDAEI